MSTDDFAEGSKALERLGFDPANEVDVLRALSEPIRKVPRDELEKLDLADAIVLNLSEGLKHYFAVVVLARIGTLNSVDALKNCLTSKDQDLRTAAVSGLARLLGAEGREICIQALQDPAFKNKAGIMRTIRDYDDGQAVPIVMKRMKSVLPRKNYDRDSEGMTEVTYALDYLRRIRASELSALQSLVWEQWDNLCPSTCSWVAVNMPEIMPGPDTPVLTTDQFLEQLEKKKFFEGFTPEAARKAKALIRKNHKQGLAGSGAKYFRRFPGFALIFLSIDGEWDLEPYEPLVKAFAKASFGLFAPKKIKDVRNEQERTATLSFEVDGTSYDATTEDQGGWIPSEFLEVIEKAFKKHCNGFEIFETFYPESGQSSSWTFCRPKAYRALVKAGLLPVDADAVSSI